MRSFALFCARLHSFALLCLRSFTLICALLRSFALFCQRPGSERPRLGTADSYLIGQRQMGRQNVSCDCIWGGGGRRAHSPKRTLEASASGLVWSVPASSKENDRASRNGREGEVSQVGGVQNRFWTGVLWYVFPSPEFSTPRLPLSDLAYIYICIYIYIYAVVRGFGPFFGLK